MLPGFRFLFAAIIMSISILIFGLGAAALLRAAHEEFASNPTWRAPPETVFAQQSEPPRTVLAALVVEPSPAEKPEILANTAPEAAIAAPEQAAAPKLAETSPREAAKAPPLAETPPASEPVPANAAPEAPAIETKIAAIEEARPPASETAAAASEQASAPAAPAPDKTAPKIATLGSPAVAVATPPPSKAESAAPDRSAIKKRLRAKRARERRRLAAEQRARLARQAASQPAIDLFAPQPPQVR